MDTNAENLLVRQHERHRCDAPGWLLIAAEHAEAVRLAAGAVDSTGSVRVSIQDCSLGGVGVLSTVFIPKRALVTLSVPETAASPALKIALRVMRVVMMDRKPTYYLGLGPAQSAGPELEENLKKFIALAQVTGAGKELPRA
ncbi:hypothetical protein BH11PLA1_BH11PLA1_18800 [soil metagenome]